MKLVANAILIVLLFAFFSVFAFGLVATLINGIWAIRDIREMGWKAYFRRGTHYTGPR